MELLLIGLLGLLALVIAGIRVGITHTQQHNSNTTEGNKS
jgi:hypothetical protein